MEIQYYYFSLFIYTFTSNNWLCLLKQSSPPYYDSQWKDWTNFWCVVVYIFFLSIWKIVIKAFSFILDVLWMVLSIMLFFRSYSGSLLLLLLQRSVFDCLYSMPCSLRIILTAVWLIPTRSSCIISSFPSHILLYISQ